MTIEQLKTAWTEFDQKLAKSQRLNDQLISSMLKERSHSRVEKIRRNNSLYLLLMCLNIGLIAAIFAGNPFDFIYAVQFIPYGLLAIGVLLAITYLLKCLQSLKSNMIDTNLQGFLRNTIAAYEKNKKIQQWFGIFIFAAGTLTALSFLPKKLEHKSAGLAIGETVLMMTITVAIYFVAYKLGAFKTREKEGFENDLKEWTALRSISSELEETA